VVGRTEQAKLDRLIQEVARGQRTLEGIHDPAVREAVRVALRLHKEAPSGPDDYARMRMRARVMSGLRPRRPTFRENAWSALWYFGRPEPYIVRSVALAAILVCSSLGATLASADSLPDDVFYPVKIASESVRLALAGTPQDRAAVELTMAEHRLVEAEKLASTGRTSDALVASAIYTQHIASAAAELAPQAHIASVGAQFEQSFNAQRDRAQALATTLSLDVSSARGAEILAMIAAPTLAPGRTQIERVAETAASLAVDLADAAEDEATQTTTRADARRTPSAVVATGRNSEVTDTPRPQTSPNSPARAITAATPRATPATARASDAAKATRKAAEQARAAAEKLKQRLKDIRDKQSGNQGHSDGGDEDRR
jgi:hypothetical protein